MWGHNQLKTKYAPCICQEEAVGKEKVKDFQLTPGFALQGKHGVRENP